MCGPAAVAGAMPLLGGLPLAARGAKEVGKALTPEIPAMPAPPALQDQKTPDMAALRKRRAPASTLLTGPTGVATGALTTGAPTLLGG